MTGIKTEAWVLHERVPKDLEGILDLELKDDVLLPEPADDLKLVYPIYITWEGNLGHAMEAKPLDVVRQRNVLLRNQGKEKLPYIVLGNGGVVADEAGNFYMFFCNGQQDEYGYPEKIAGYDDLEGFGLLAKKTVVRQNQLIPIPKNSSYSLIDWASFSLRGVTAWANWDQAIRRFRVQVEESDKEVLDVVAWGGAVSLYELEKAKSDGHNAYMIASGETKLELIKSRGIQPIDRGQFPNLNEEIYNEARAIISNGGDADKFKEKYGKTPDEFRRAFLDDKSKFHKVIRTEIGKGGVDIFIQNIGSAVEKVTREAIGRTGSITRSGWKTGRNADFSIAVDCIERFIPTFTHYARMQDGLKAIQDFENGVMPPFWDEDKIYDFSEFNDLGHNYIEGKFNLIPVGKVNDH